jgi:D-alanyl-D-alanine carboxypeptidase/D-alanyl-D-alanine-endopeptidase (penicillin-binding protein 4)
MKFITLFMALIFFSTAYGEFEDLEKKINYLGLNRDNLGLYVKNLITDDEYKINPNKKFNFASVNKIITSLIAIDELGPSFQFETNFLYTGSIENNVLYGDLIIKGSGDASFSIEDLRYSLNQVYQSGIHEIRGDIIFDQSFFEQSQNEIIDQEKFRAYNADPVALSIQANVVDFSFLKKQSDLKIINYPPAKDIEVRNNLKLTNNNCSEWKSDLGFKDFQEAAKLVLYFDGSYSLRCPNNDAQLLIQNRSLYFYLMFKDIWNAFGGFHLGGYREDFNPTVADANPIYTYKSQALSKLLVDLNKNSLNLMARNFGLRILSKKNSNPSNEASINNYFKKYLLNLGVNSEDLFLENSAGLSRTSYGTVELFEKVLEHINQSNYRYEIFSSMPILGIDGTMKKFGQTASYKGQGHFKTGSLKDVYALAGILKNKKGENCLIVFVVNDQLTNKVPRALDKIIEFVYLN